MEFFIALCEYLRATEDGSSSSASSSAPVPLTVSPDLYEEIKKEFEAKGRDLAHEIHELRATLRRKVP